MRYIDSSSHARYATYSKLVINDAYVENWLLYDDDVKIITQAVSDVVKTPGWRYVIASGGNATTDYSRVGTKVSLNPGVMSATFTSPRYQQAYVEGHEGDQNYLYQKVIGTWTHELRYEGTFNHWGPSVHAARVQLSQEGTLSGLHADNVAKTAFLEAIKGVQQNFAGLVFVGTIHEAWHGIRHPAEALVTAYKTTGQKMREAANISGIADLTRRVSKELHTVLGGLWLEFQFGVAPLVSDVEDAAAACAELVTRSKGGMVRVSGYGEESFQTTNDTPQYAFSINCPGQYMFNCYEIVDVQETVSVKYVGGVRNNCDQTAARARESFGITWNELVATGWELTPWSFVADYFLNIGSILESLNTRTSTLAWASKTTIVKRKAIFKMRAVSVSGIFNLQEKDGGSVTYEYINMHRTVPVDYSIAPEFKFPDLGSKKWINLLALVRL